MKVNGVKLKKTWKPWGNLAILMSVLTYGFWGYGPSIQNVFEIQSRPKTAIHSILYHLLLISCISFFLKHQRNNEIAITRKKITLYVPVISVLTLLVLLIRQYSIVTSNFTGDELAYLQSSYLFVFEIMDLFNDQLLLLGGSAYLSIALLLSVTISILMLLIFKKVLYVDRSFNILLVIFTILVLRIGNDTFMQYGGTYPNVYGTFLQLINFLGFAPILLRSAQWLVLTFLVLLIYKRYWEVNRIGTYLFGFTSTTLFALSTFWTTIDPAVVFGPFAFLIITLTIKKPNNYFETAIKILAIGVFIRPTLIILLPLIIIRKALESKSWKFKISEFSPILVLIPYLFETSYQNVTSQLTGTRYADPAAFALGTNPIAALLQSVVNQFSNFSLIVLSLLIALLILLRSSRSSVLTYLIIVFSIYSYLIPQATQGLNKYALESFFPVALIGMATLIEYLSGRNSIPKYVSALIILAYCNYQQVDNLNNIDKKIDGWRQAPLINNYPVDNSNAYKFIGGDKSLRNSCLNPGITYGVPHYFLAGFSKSNLDDLQEVFNRNSPTFVWGSMVINLTGLEAMCLIIDNYPLKGALYEELTRAGWTRIYLSRDTKLGTGATVWKRLV
jgi:hypothetical protein